MFKVLSKCPVCDGDLIVTKLKCGNCNTIIENEFIFSKFEGLSNEQLKFIEVFLKCRGNIKDVERELGVSYPTVRAKLDDVISALNLGRTEKSKETSKNNNKILDMLEKGEINAEEAMNMLK
ncbi:DUF2089 domain-containing protein [Clostridium fallax]|uniref:DUF2089 domain-containing protein n=1 Tax=Clostridium fallax TaxID=1533 RepID=A0A1M4TVJ6_9CLOT|nr:DUF2089 domain-containing protein [Clostridium fallax]SHE48460.1 hypothetical protein SAMN05443638_103144 [Clostridium fallax]SQB22372.1 Protein of uncharacterised function(DUF2089) [Clostridium fallax]